MAKFSVLVEFDTGTGDYEMEFKNISEPGVGIEYNMVKEALRRIFGDFIETHDQAINIATKDAKRNDN